MLVLATVPLWPVVWLVVLASLARLRLGFWPSYAHPDPKDLHWPVLDVRLLLLAPAPVLIAVGVALRRRVSGRADWRLLRWAVGSFLILVLWLVLDPGGFVEWWLD
jgi:hypothetical protein